MAKHIHSILTTTIICTLFLSYAHSKTLQSEVEVLRSITLAIDPISITRFSFLHTWNFNLDPCESTGGNFLGIVCTIPQDNSSSQVTAIDLEGDRYEGFLTPAIGNLTELTILNLRKNQFRGPIPQSITSLTKLTTLLLSGNFFSGSIPPRIDRLKKLENLDLSQNMLSGSIPASISGFRSLNRLILSNNEFIGSIPDLNGLWQLHTLDLGKNQLYGSFPLLPQNLRTLVLSHNLLSGHISSIRRLPDLESLDLSDNRFSGTIDQEIFTLPMLRSINVSSNRFTSMPVMKSSDSESQLQVIDAHANQLHGHLPVNLFTYSNVTFVNLGHNLFNGRIPLVYGEKLGNNWRNLFLDYNFLQGDLPPEFFSTPVRFTGSLAHNCLNCPNTTVEACRGGQRPASECVNELI